MPNWLWPNLVTQLLSPVQSWTHTRTQAGFSLLKLLQESTKMGKGERKTASFGQTPEKRLPMNIACIFCSVGNAMWLHCSKKWQNRKSRNKQTNKPNTEKLLSVTSIIKFIFTSDCDLETEVKAVHVCWEAAVRAVVIFLFIISSSPSLHHHLPKKHTHTLKLHGRVKARRTNAIWMLMSKTA